MAFGRELEAGSVRLEQHEAIRIGLMDVLLYGKVKRQRRQIISMDTLYIL